MARAPRKWPPRVFALYLAATAVGGAILVLFLIVVGLLYWMNARVALPDSKRLIYPKATAWLAVKAESLDDLPEETLPYLTKGAPPQVGHLIARAGGERPCPIQFVLSAFPDVRGGRQMSLAVSLGGYPGQFWLVRRDLERRVEKQSLAMALRYHDHKAIFSGGDPSDSLSTLSLVRCTLLRCASPEAAEVLIDRMEKPSGTAPGTAPGRASFEGWAASLQEMPLKLFFPAARSRAGEGRSGWREWQEAPDRIKAAYPELAQIPDITFSGSFTSRQTAELKVTFRTDKNGAAAMAGKINSVLGGARLAGSGDVVELTGTIQFGGD